jgi:hypothetical protein
VARNLAVAAVFLLLLAMVAKPVWEGREQWNFGQFGDDGVYMVTAKSLAQGDGYRVLSLPGKPFAVKYPPLYPLYLSIAWRIQPNLPDTLRVAATMQALLLPVFLALMMAVLRQLGLSWTRTLWIAATMLVTVPMVLMYVTLFAELLFFSLLFASILVIQRSADTTDDSATWLALAGGLITGLAYLARNAALPMLAAAPVFYFLRKKPKLAVWFLLLALPISAGWHVWTFTHGGLGATGTNASYLNEYVNIIHVTGFWNNLWKQLGSVSSSIAENLIPGIVTLLLGFPLFHMVFLAAIVGNVRLSRRTPVSIYSVFAVPYVVMVLLWWFEGVARLLLPIWPLIGAGLTEEASHFLSLVDKSESSFKRRVARWALVAVGVLLVIRTDAGAWAQVHSLLAQDRSDRLQDLPAYAWLLDHRKDNAVVLTWNDSTAYLYSGATTSRGLFVTAMPLGPEYKAVSTKFSALPPEYKDGYLVLLKSDLSEELGKSGKHPFQSAAEALPDAKLVFRSTGAMIYSFSIPR